MSATSRASVLGLLVLVLFPQTGCNMVPQQTLRQSQLRSWQLAGQNRQLSQTNAALKSNLDVSSQRLTNLSNERTLLHQRYLNLLKQQSPLSQNATRRLEELRKRFPRFQFDPQSGVCKIGDNDDILFATGSAQLNTKAVDKLLLEFARIMNDGEAKKLNILVVGHTDDRRIAR
ncbi:MAG: flagellar motor protein MotB, partial [Planctomycetaceae bacterium]